MRQRGDGGGDPASRLLDQEMLATHEQEEVIADLRRTLIRDARTWRTLFAPLGLALAAGFAYFAACQFLAPWVSFRHHSEFKETLSAGAVAAAEMASAMCLAAPALALLRFMPAAASISGGGGGGGGNGTNGVDSGGRGIAKVAALTSAAAEMRVLNGALAAAAAMAVFWGRAILAAGAAGLMSARQQLQSGWLPVAPLAFVLLAASVVRSYRGMAEKLKALEAQRYTHEGA